MSEQFNINKINKISEIMKENNIADFGVMKFSEINSLIECRAKSRLPENPKSVIVCIFPYYTGELENHNVCRYATLTDYHECIGKVLTKICEQLKDTYNNNFECFADISPIPEVYCAVRAGLGFRGNNNLLITKKYGSYVFIGEIVTDMEIAPSKPNQESCLNCGLCKRNCPNSAIGNDSIDYKRCVSNISQRKGELNQDEILAIKRVGLAWGCDCCQDICPHNKAIKKTHIKEFLNDIEPILTKENMDKLVKTRAYGYKGKKLLNRNLDIINDE